MRLGQYLLSLIFDFSVISNTSPVLQFLVISTQRKRTGFEDSSFSNKSPP